MNEFYENNKTAIQNIIIVCGGTLASVLFFKFLFPIFVPFICGWILSLIFRPITSLLEKLHIPRSPGAILSILLFLGIIGLFSFFLGGQLREQLTGLINSLPEYLDSLEASLTAFWNRIDGHLVDLPDVVTDITGHMQEEFFSMLVSVLQGVGSTGAISAVPRFFLSTIIAFFSSYFFTKDQNILKNIYRAHLAPILGLSADHTKKDLSASLWGYVKTQLILMIYVFIVTAIGLYVIRSPYALLLSFTIAIIDAVPFFGSGFILWPGAVMHLVMGNIPLAIGYMVIYAIVQILRQLMQPKILGQQIGMHPLLTLFSMYFGFRSIGFWGLLIGPVVAVILRTVLRRRNKKTDAA